MTLAGKLGKSYEQVKEQVKLKTLTIELGAVKFNLRIRIPIKKEMEALMEKIAHPAQEKVDAIYGKLSAPLLATVNEGGEDFLKVLNAEKQMITVLDDDVIVDGNSVRQVALFTAMWETRVEEYFHLLQSEIGDPINESYEQIVEEFPEQVIREIVEDIEQAIRPDYKTAKKN